MSHKNHSSKLTITEVATGVMGRACAVCGAPAARKYCSIDCYRTVQRSGNDAERFWSKVRKTDGCWLWEANRAGGSSGKKYGQFTVTVAPGKQRHYSAHVFAYELAHGSIPDGLEVMHSCNQTLCVRPDHLSVGTHAQNVADAVRDGLYVKRDLKGRKPKKLTDEQVVEIIALYRGGMLQTRIAERFDVTKTTICLILSGKRRQRVTERKATHAA